MVFRLAPTWMTSLASACALFSPPCTVDLRDGGARIVGFLAGEGPDGVSVRAQDDPTTPALSFRWDQVERLETTAPSNERATRIELGRSLWRGRSRLSRGDLDGARAEFALALAAVSVDAQLLRALAMEGLARTSAAAADDLPRSLVAALVTAGSRATQPLPREWIGGGDPVEAQTGLVLTVLPAFLDGSRAAQAQGVLVRAAAEAVARGDRVEARLLEAAARIASADSGVGVSSGAAKGAESPEEGTPSTTVDARAQGRRALRILEAWADAVSTEPSARKRGRSVLQSVLRSLEGAPRAVAIYAIGRSQCVETDPDVVRIGVARMLTVAAAYDAEWPQLAAAARAQAAVALSRIGDDESAAVLRAINDPTIASPDGQGATP